MTVSSLMCQARRRMQDALKTDTVLGPSTKRAIESTEATDKCNGTMYAIKIFKMHLL